MSDDILARMQAALEGVTDGPWVVVGYGNIHFHEVGEKPPVAKAWGRANMSFIAESRSLVPELAAEVERLRATVERVRRLAENPATYSGTGVVAVKPGRILAALESSDDH